jgi:hypothetical protein
MKSTIFWGYKAVYSVGVSRSFGGTYRFNFNGLRGSDCHLLWFLALLILRSWKWRRNISPKLRLIFQRTTCRYIPGNRTLHAHRLSSNRIVLIQNFPKSWIKNENCELFDVAVIGDVVFEPLSGYQLSWQQFFVVFFLPFQEDVWIISRLGHNRFLLNPSQFISHPAIRLYTVYILTASSLPLPLPSPPKTKTCSVW